MTTQKYEKVASDKNYYVKLSLPSNMDPFADRGLQIYYNE